MDGLGGDAPVGFSDRFRDGAPLVTLLADCFAHFTFRQVPPLLTDRHALIHRQIVDRMVLGGFLDELTDSPLRDSKFLSDCKLRGTVDVHFPGTIALEFCFLPLFD